MNDNRLSEIFRISFEIHYKRFDQINYGRNIIYSYRVEQAMASSFDIKNDIVIYRKIICAILIHRKAMELVFILYMYIMKKQRYREVINIKVIVFSTTYKGNKISNK